MPATTSKKQKVKSIFFIFSALFYAFGLFVIVFLAFMYRETILKDHTVSLTLLGALLVCAHGIEKGLINRRKQIVGISEVMFAVFVIMIITVLFWFGILEK